MERHLEVRGVGLRFDELGDGPVVVFLHGFPLDRTLWRHQLRSLDGVRRIAPDLRGMGESSAPEGDYTMAHYATDVLGLLDALGVPRAAFCGLSMGGYVLMEILRRAPERVSAVALVDTRAEPDSAEGRRARDASADRAAREGVEAVARALLPKLLGRTTRARRPEVTRHALEMMVATPLGGFVGALRAMRDRPDSRNIIRQLRVPALVVVGEEDEVTPPATARDLAGMIPDARLVEVAGAGHLTPLESPAQVTSALAAFFDGALKPA